VPDLTRFAGYESPAAILADAALTREQKIAALLAWRNGLLLLGGDDHARLVGEVDQALERLHDPAG
jgi:hypothetical protein